jgi:hypothetical protein
MACQFCTDGHPKRLWDNYWVHDIPGTDVRACEDQPPKQYDRLDESEKARLFLLAEIASEIRMEHAVSLYKAIDWTREVLALGTVDTNRQQVIKFILERFGHVCSPVCQEAKRIE